MRWIIAIYAMSCLPVFSANPVTERVDQVDDYHGTKVSDPYRWLEDLSSEKTRAWIQSQQAYTGSWFKSIPGRTDLQARMKRLWNFDQTPLAPGGERAGFSARGGRVFYFRQTGLQNQPVLYVKDSPSAKARVLLDVNTLSPDGTVALSSWDPSPDGNWVAYGLAKAGSDWQQWRIRNVKTTQDLPDLVDWIKFSFPAWSGDSSGVYYGRYPKPAGDTLTGVNENHQLYYHRLKTDQSEDKLIYERPDQKDWLLIPVVSEDGRYLAIHIYKGTLAQNLIFYKDLKAKDDRIHELISEFYAIQTLIGNRSNRLLIQTTYEAPKGRVVSVDLSKPDRKDWVEVVPESEYTLVGASMDGTSIALNYLKDATGLVRVHSLDGGSVYQPQLPPNSTVSLADRSVKYFSVASFTTPETIYDCGNDGKQCRPFLDIKLPFDSSTLESRQVFYQSKDGTKIPMFIVHRKGLKLDGSNPTLLYGYGGFNVSITPSFSPKFLGFMELGGVIGVANLRGGGEYGETWHNAGMKQKKQNVFDDFIAAAEWLIAEKYTSPSKLAISGGSNGGLLVGACVNQRPDLFAAAIPSVGVMDMLRFHKFTIGAAWATEYGSPENREDFPTIYKYSPLHNIKEGASYPATLILTADHDDRVVPSHSFKYAATLQRAQGGEAPVLIRIETSAGHGAGKPRGKRIEEDADVLSFLMRTLGMEAP